MKKMLAFLSAVLLSAGPTFAQTTTPPATGPASYQQERSNLTPEQRADRQAQYLARQLSLTPEQMPTVRALVLSQAQKLETLRSSYATTGSRQGLGPELKAAQTSFETQLKQLLTAEQYARYSELRADRLDKRRESRAGRQSD